MMKMNMMKMNMMNMMTRSDEMSNLKKIRNEKGISQSQLASASGVPVRAIQVYEQGYRDINKAQAIAVYRLANALGCTMENLIEKEQD